MAFSPITSATVGFSSNQSNVEYAKLIAGTNPGTICFTEDGNIVVGGNVYSVYLITGVSSLTLSTYTSWDAKSVWLTTDGKIIAPNKDNTALVTYADLTSNTTGNLANYTDFDELADDAKFVDALNDILSKVKPVVNKTSGIVYCKGILAYGASPAISDIGSYYLYYNKVNGTAVLNSTITRNSGASTDTTIATCSKGVIYNVNGTNYVFNGTECKVLQEYGAKLTINGTEYNGTTDKTVDITAESLGLSSAFKLKGDCLITLQLEPKYFDSEEEVTGVSDDDFVCIGNDIFIYKDGGLTLLTGNPDYSLYVPVVGLQSNDETFVSVVFPNKENKILIQSIYRFINKACDTTWEPQNGWVFTDESYNEWYYNNSWKAYGDEGSYCTKDEVNTIVTSKHKISGDSAYLEVTDDNITAESNGYKLEVGTSGISVTDGSKSYDVVSKFGSIDTKIQTLTDTFTEDEKVKSQALNDLETNKAEKADVYTKTEINNSCVQGLNSETDGYHLLNGNDETVDVIATVSASSSDPGLMTRTMYDLLVTCGKQLTWE